MPATIKIKNSSTASAVPTSSDLVQGELAVNVTDKRLFTENASGTVVELGTNPTILTLPDGSASAPTLTNDGDTNTGIFFPAADTVGIATGGTERARVDSSGNLGIGTTSPNYPATIYKATFPTLQFINSASGSTASDGLLIYLNGTTATISNEESGPLTFQTAGTLRATLDSAGNMGLGVTPSAWTIGKALELGNVGNSIWGAQSRDLRILSGAYYNGSYIYTANGYASRYDVNNAQNGGHAWYTAPSGTIGGTITFTQAMTLDASGNLGIGTSSPSTRLHVSAPSSTGQAAIINSANANGAYTTFQSSGTSMGDVGSLKGITGTGNATDMAINARSSGVLALCTGDTERARIDSSGNLLVGTTSTSGTSGVGVKTLVSATAPDIAVVGSSTSSGDVGFQLYSTGAAAYRFYVAYNGTISATSTTISAISDIRFKENVRDLDAGLAEVMALKPRLYDWKEGKGADIKNARGFIAQEFEEVFPDLIDEWRDPAPEGEEPYKSVRADLIPVLVKAIQELKAEFDAYKASHP
jgi:hypothetical protein